MKKIILIAAILLGALTNGQAQVINKNYAKRIGQAVKEGYQDVKGVIVQDTKPTGEHTIWDIYAAPKVGLNLLIKPLWNRWENEYWMCCRCFF